MKSQIQSWWKKIKEHPIASIVISIAIIGALSLIIVIILGYCFNWAWTGLGPYTPPNSNYQRGKTLWDWMQLLIIPAVLAVAGYAFTLTTSQNERRATEQRSLDEQKAAEQRNKTERDIALDNQRETELQDYIDKMSELLLEKNLRNSQTDDEVRKIARVRTLTTLPRLDANRKKSILQFLYESGLINKKERIIDLNGADFRNADLRNTDFRNANLSYADFRNANLSHADLRSAILNNAHLSGAKLIEAGLSDICLSYAHLEGANLRYAYLRYADLSNAHLSSADFSYADLYKANLSEAILTDAGLSGIVLIGAGVVLSNAIISYANLSNANLKDADITEEQLKQAKSLKGATMPDASKHS